MKISRDQDSVELDGPPAFEYGEKVQSRKYVRNDGTFPGKEIGDILVAKGDVGYITGIGSFLQQFYIYSVEFIDSGYRVGMKRRELVSLDYDDEDEEEENDRQVEALAHAEAAAGDTSSFKSTTSHEVAPS